MKVVVGAPFASGLLTDPPVPGTTYGYAPAPEAMRTKALAIEAVCGRHGMPLVAAALQFPLAHPAVVSVIPGADSPAQARQNAGRAIPGQPRVALMADGLIDPEAAVGGNGA